MAFTSKTLNILFVNSICEMPSCFRSNYAVFRDSRSTIVAGTAGQHYVDNIFFDPDNDYEMITVNRSL